MADKITFISGDVELEGELSIHEQPSTGIVIQHPHPSFGGDMHNNVVGGVWMAAHNAKLSALRFNMRGVGASTGEHTNLQKEPDDAIEAARFLISKGIGSVGMIGYSFGAMSTLIAADKSDILSAIAVIAPPVAMYDASAIKRIADRLPTLIITGTQDDFCPLSKVEDMGLPFKTIQGSDHFFAGREAKVGELAVQFAMQNLF